MSKLKVLLSAFAVSPYRGSEGGLGWSVATHLALYHDVTVIYGDLSDEVHKFELEKYFAENGSTPNLKFHFVAAPKLAKVLDRVHLVPGLWFLHYVAYNLWQEKAYREAKLLHSRERFDLVHQLTYATFRAPGSMWKLPIPFFWGPVSGAADVSLGYRRVLGVRGTVGYALRAVSNYVQKRLSPAVRRAARAARLTWVCTPAEMSVIQAYGGKAAYQLEVGTDLALLQLRNRSVGEKLRVVWSGIMIPRKALILAIESIAKYSGPVEIELHLLGDGPERRRASERASELGIQKNLVWHGNVSRPKALSVMAASHVLIHTSLLEATSTVVLEALSLGLPVVCHDSCGMAAAITSGCGIKIAQRSPEESVSGFASALETLATDARRYKMLADGAAVRANELTWKRKVEEFSEAYAEAVTLKHSQMTLDSKAC